MIKRIKYIFPILYIFLIIIKQSNSNSIKFSKVLSENELIEIFETAENSNFGLLEFHDDQPKSENMFRIKYRVKDMNRVYNYHPTPLMCYYFSDYIYSGDPTKLPSN
ncbi:hypothetical protein ACTFIU_009982, partial [Dictyostelium citrinum]